MNPRSSHRTPTQGISLRRLAVVAVASSALVVAGASMSSAEPLPVPLGTAASFVVLAGTGVTATGANTLNGDIGSHPNTSITGVGTITINGTNHGGDGVTQGAKADLVNAYLNAESQGPTLPIAADLAGLTLTSGVYNSASQVLLTGALTLNAEGNEDAVFVFQAGSDLIVGSGAAVVLTNGAQACNVYWQVGSSATLGSSASFNGTILALTSITFDPGVTVRGRALARNGNVVLNNTTILDSGCQAVVEDDDTDDSGGSDDTARGNPVVGAEDVPVGGVQTGDGSSVTPSNSASLTAGTVFATAVVTVGAVILIRRRFRSREL